MAPPPQTADEPETQRPVEEVTAAQPDRLAATTEDALRSRYQTQGIDGAAQLNGGGLIPEAADSVAASAASDSETPAQGVQGTRGDEIQAQPATWARNTPYSGAVAGQGQTSAEGGLPINLVA
ncbi:hypothetical protein D779_2361 [Imhoffiella purpurea]|uniref:Uncharacterized protein n=1 Tax=Imhoffiella purpurea TaxID=1249627 RepID=W9V5E6_9GAMM|nr:hypothetical protein D779_2361 [Imhoffiella purpurea]